MDGKPQHQFSRHRHNPPEQEHRPGRPQVKLEYVASELFWIHQDPRGGTPNREIGPSITVKITS